MKHFAVQTTINGQLHRLRTFANFDDAMTCFLQRVIIAAANRGKAPADLLRLAKRHLPVLTWDAFKIEIVEIPPPRW